MVAAIYVRAHATATRLIDRYGKPAVLVREERTGPPHAPVVTPVEHPVTLVETGYSLTNRDSTLVQAGDKMGLISTGGTPPALDDKLRIDGSRYSFVDLQPLNPGGLVLLYEFHCRS